MQWNFAQERRLDADSVGSTSTASAEHGEAGQAHSHEQSTLNFDTSAEENSSHADDIVEGSVQGSESDSEESRDNGRRNPVTQ